MAHDEVSIYNRRGRTEIQAIYTASVTASPGSLPPFIITQPAINCNVGDTADLQRRAGGINPRLPMAFQRFQPRRATSSTLTISNVHAPTPHYAVIDN